MTRRLFLDDKNTFAVNNAGRDGDGRTGIIVTCWGQNVPAAVKQQTVCERSTDAGRTWTNPPVPVSDLQQLVIGVHVIADPRDENTFHAVWLQYATALAGQPETMEYSKSTDGGQTWSKSRTVASIEGIPRTFPEQSFRNLSIPIMAASPRGELYLTYAEYLPAPDPGTDLDGKQSDIRLHRSTDGGASWSPATTVNQDRSNADQFQPYVAVTPDGQVNVFYFDRRHDPRSTSGALPHPGNYFIDSYLSRSNDGGRTFTDVRFSHDMSDPSINPPISGSGDFYGDYQGLVADDIGAIPFVQDTHLANDRSRDPEFDRGMPRSQYQEVFSWEIPNTADFGGVCVNFRRGIRGKRLGPAYLSRSRSRQRRVFKGARLRARGGMTATASRGAARCQRDIPQPAEPRARAVAAPGGSPGGRSCCSPPAAATASGACGLAHGSGRCAGACAASAATGWAATGGTSSAPATPGGCSRPAAGACSRSGSPTSG